MSIWWVSRPPGLRDVVWHLSLPIWWRGLRLGFARFNKGSQWFLGVFTLVKAGDAR